MIEGSTQEHLDIYDIKDNFVITKNGGVSAVLQTTAVNFDLLSEIEQDAMISAFSMLLNSINFQMQVVVRSKRLDISKYIEKVDKVEKRQEDQLLRTQARGYKNFVQDIIEKNDVLDKKFYVVVSSGGSDLNINTNPFDWLLILFGYHTKRKRNIDINKSIDNAKPDLLPKIDHLTGEFNRLGVKTKQLTTQELVELYFDIYNPSSIHGQRIRTSIEDYKTAIVSPAMIEE